MNAGKHELLTVSQAHHIVSMDLAVSKDPSPPFCSDGEGLKVPW